MSPALLCLQSYTKSLDGHHRYMVKSALHASSCDNISRSLQHSSSSAAARLSCEQVIHTVSFAAQKAQEWTASCELFNRWRSPSDRAKASQHVRGVGLYWHAQLNSQTQAPLQPKKPFAWRSNSPAESPINLWYHTIRFCSTLACTLLVLW